MPASSTVPLVATSSQAVLLRELMNAAGAALVEPAERVGGGIAWRTDCRLGRVSVSLLPDAFWIRTEPGPRQPPGTAPAFRIELGPPDIIGLETLASSHERIDDDDAGHRTATAIVRSWQESLADPIRPEGDEERRMLVDHRRDVALALVALADAGHDVEAAFIWRNEMKGGCDGQWLSVAGWHAMPPKIAQWLATFPGYRKAVGSQTMSAQMTIPHMHLAEAVEAIDPVTRLRIVGMFPR